MSQWSFVIAAYAVTALAGTAVSAWAFLAMRRAERRADAVTRR